LLVPIGARGTTIGVILVGSQTARNWKPSELSLLEELGRRLGAALDSARIFNDLTASEERYRRLVEEIRDHAIFSLDKDGRISSWNSGAQRLFRWDAADTVGKDLATFYAEADVRAGKPAQDLAKARAEGILEEEGLKARADGTTFWANLLIARLGDASGSAGFSVVMRDLSERRRSAEALEHARRQVMKSEKLSTMGTLVSGVFHEVRTPLTAIMNSVMTIERRLAALGLNDSSEGAALVHESLKMCRENVQRINSLVLDMRRFMNVQPGQREVVPLDAVVAEGLELFQAAYRGHIRITTDLKATRPVHVERFQIQQIVLNLVQNSAEAMQSGGEVRISTSSTDTSAILVVEDDGVGMTNEVRDRMFEEFFTTKATGTGLGLSIVRRIVESHGGTIECESELGKGTRFIITLPHAKERAPATGAPRQAS
jgi:PAS domain S-box-containing protein